MTTKKPSDQQLVERVKKGDKRAFDLLVIKYQQRLLILANRFVKNEATAQDIVQEAFIKAYKALPKFRGDSQFYTWIYRITANTAKNHLSSQSRKANTTDILPEDAEFMDVAQDLRTVDSPEAMATAEILEERVHDAIANLPKDLKTALWLREFDGLSYEEIAEVMNCPIGTVRSRIFRAREALETVIKNYQENG
ncbi:MAG: RNA polymerase sigma factor RpoE [Pseudomonadota bacterium]|nr:RNA polymerase sigma factor RpoE [Pseudomonadota bacterium]